MRTDLFMTVIVMYCCMCSSIHAQISIHGKIVDIETNDPVIGANIRIDNSLAGCSTNSEGEFNINNLSSGKHSLSITHLSYKPLSITVHGEQKELDIRMHESYMNIGQVVVTGTGTHHRMTDSPIPIAVITSKDINNSGISTLGEALLKLTPSFSSMTNGMGTTLSLNGLPDNYFIFLLNGKRMSGDNTYSRINIQHVKRIEILNGASSALYGTNAIGGVINIISDDAKNAVSISNNTHYANKGRLVSSVNADIAEGKFGSYTSYQRQEANSWQLSPFEEINNTLKETNKIASCGFHSDNITQHFTFDFTDKLSFYLRGGYYNNKTRRPQDVYSYDMLHETYSYGIGSKYIINREAYISADYYADYFISTYCFFKDDTKNNALNGDEQIRKRTRFHDATIKGIFNINSWNKLSVGSEYMFDILKSQTDNINKESAYTIAFFAQDEIKITRSLQALLGLRYLYHENFRNYATPNVALMYKLNHFNFRGSYATGFRTPTLSEMYATDIAKTTDRMTIGNTNLKPEKSDYFSFNTEYTHSRFAVSANLFYNKIRDMIDYNTIAQGNEALKQYGYKEVRQRDNIAKAKVKGISLSANGYIGAGFSMNAGFSHLNTLDMETNKPIDKSIKNAITTGILWQHTWNKYQLSTNITGRINSKRYSKTYGYAPAYQLFDLNTRHSFRFKFINLEPSIGIENLFNYIDDRPYNSNYATLSPGRSFYISFSIKYKN